MFRQQSLLQHLMLQYSSRLFCLHMCVFPSIIIFVKRSVYFYDARFSEKKDITYTNKVRYLNSLCPLLTTSVFYKSSIDLKAITVNKLFLFQYKIKNNCIHRHKSSHIYLIHILFLSLSVIFCSLFNCRGL